MPQAYTISLESLRYATLMHVMNPPFFDGVKWEDLRSILAPFIPATLGSEIDTAHKGADQETAKCLANKCYLN